MPEAVELHLVRHGIAEERGPEWPDDAKRPLTRKGSIRLKEEVAGLAVLGVTFDLVLTSPLVRTRQSADLIARRIAGRPRVLPLEALSPGGSPSRILAALRAHAGTPRIACVGHEPDLGKFAAALIGAPRPLEFKKGAICRIDLDGLPPSGPGVLRWFAPPRLLRRSADA
jgi:phosphohistidine phosphatase